PEQFGRQLSNVAVMVEHDGGPPGLLGLYEGIPLTSRGSAYRLAAPDVITIYRQAICALCETEQQVADQVRRTVVHEVGHYFGLDDARLDELGWEKERRGAGALLEDGRVARPVAQDLRLLGREVDDRRGLKPAVAGVQDGVHDIAQLLFDLPALSHRLIL